MKVPLAPIPRTRRSDEATPYLQQANGLAVQSGRQLAASLGSAAETLGNVGGLLNEQAEKARRFGQLQSFSAFQTAVDKRLTELKRDSDPAQANYADQAVAVYHNMQTEWLATVPDEFYDEFKTRAADVAGAVARDALEFQYKRTDDYFRQGVADAVNQSLLSLDQDGSLANLDAQTKAVDDYISSTALTEAEKVAQRRAAYVQMEKVTYKSEVRRGHIEASAVGVGRAQGTATDLLIQFDGKSMENGLTYEQNRELMQSRAESAERMAVESLGDTALWGAMPARAQAAVISLVDDKGELPASVKKAIGSGNLQEVADAVAALGGERRAQEAQLILGLGALPEGQLDRDARFADIPYEDRLALRADAEREAAAITEQQQKQQKAIVDAQVNDLFVGLFDGTKGQHDIEQARDAGVLTDINDITKANKLLNDHDTKQALVRLGLSKLDAGVTFNPASTEDKKALNALVGDEGLAALQNQDASYVTSVLVPMARKAQDLPTDTVGLLTGMMRSQDPKAALFALDTLSQLEQASPDAYQARVTEPVAADVRYWQTVKDYYSPEEVLASIRGGRTQQERTQNDYLRAQARALISGAKPEVAFDPIKALGDNPAWQFGDPTMTSGARAGITRDFNELFEREYTRDGNAAHAKQRAIEALGRVWQVSNIGGQQTLMKYPPELVGYPTWNGSRDWITKQGLEELNENAKRGLPPGREPNITSFQLISDEQTKSEAEEFAAGGPPPSYLVTYRDAEGNPTMPTDAEGKPLRLYFQITPEMEAEKVGQVQNAKAWQDNYQFMMTYNSALRHSLETGIPIPDEIQQEYKQRTQQGGAW